MTGGFWGRPAHELSPEQRAMLGSEDIRAVLGHFPFGVHESIRRPFSYLTLLRDPVDRVVSLYYHILRWPHEALHDRLVQEKVTLEEFVASGAFRDATNDQCRRISGLYDLAAEDSSRMLELARQNIAHHFCLVGLTERFDETLLLLKRMLGWSYLLYYPKVVNEQRVGKHALPRSTLDLIARHNELDFALYDFAKKRFEALVAQQTDEFQAELATFREQKPRYAADQS